MKNLINIFIILFVIVAAYFIFAYRAKADRACDAFIVVSNNSLFELNVTVDGFPSGNLLIGKSKLYTVILNNDTPKKIKVKVEYQDPDYIFPKSINFVTKEKLECGQTDTVFVAFTK